MICGTSERTKRFEKHLHVNFQYIKRSDGKVGGASTEHSSNGTKAIIPGRQILADSSLHGHDTLKIPTKRRKLLTSA